MGHRNISALLGLVLLGLFGWAGENSARTDLPRVGIIGYVGGTEEARRKWLLPFRKKLAELGWIEGKQFVMELGRDINDPSQLAAVVAELIERNVDVILADSAPSVRVAHAATSSIPIVAADFTSDPIKEGYAKSYGRPGNNITGVFLDAPDFSGKWIELLKAIVPDLSRVAVLWDPSPGAAHLNAIKRLAGSNGLKIQIIEVRTPEDIDRAFSAFHGRPQALITLPSPLMFFESERLAALALRHRLPATSMTRQFSDAGGMVAYGPERFHVYERAAGLVAKILAGAKPGDLPIERPTKFELIVNLKTAKALGVTIPQAILVQASEVLR